MDRHNILSLLGLSLRGGRLAVGEEPVEAVARARDARVLLLASDAADNTRRRCQHFAQAGDCLWLQLPFTKAELGQAVGRRAAAMGIPAPAGGLSSGMHPPFSFPSCGKENGPCTVQKKRPLGRAPVQ